MLSCLQFYLIIEVSRFPEMPICYNIKYGIVTMPNLYHKLETFRNLWPSACTSQRGKSFIFILIFYSFSANLKFVSIFSKSAHSRLTDSYNVQFAMKRPQNSAGDADDRNGQNDDEAEQVKKARLEEESVEMAENGAK